MKKKIIFLAAFVLLTSVGVWGQNNLERRLEQHPEIRQYLTNAIKMAYFYFGGNNDKTKALLFDATVFVEKLEKQDHRNLLEVLAEAIDEGEKPIIFFAKYFIAHTPLQEGRDESECYVYGCLIIAVLCANNASLSSILPDAIAVFANKEIESALKLLNEK
jgi:hypothetical protein